MKGSGLSKDPFEDVTDLKVESPWAAQTTHIETILQEAAIPCS